MLSTTDEPWTNLADAADGDATRGGALGLRGTRDGSEGAPPRAGVDALPIDPAALERCIRADLWP
jgi:hypothetical protein